MTRTYQESSQRAAGTPIIFGSITLTIAEIEAANGVFEQELLCRSSAGENDIKKKDARDLLRRLDLAHQGWYPM